jgi:hypothetical protein
MQCHLDLIKGLLITIVSNSVRLILKPKLDVVLTFTGLLGCLRNECDMLYLFSCFVQVELCLNCSVTCLTEVMHAIC